MKAGIIAKLDRHIEVVTTETSGMKETGFGSVETCRRVCDVLRTRYSEVHFSEVQSELDLQRIVDSEPDLVVLCVKYIYDEEQQAKIWLSEYFSEFDIPYTGSDRTVLEFDSDKGKAKHVLLENDVATAKFFLAIPGMFASEGHLPLLLPLFVKPLNAANGNGVDEYSLVHDFASFEAKVEEICATYGNSALVEEVLSGREFTVAVLDDAGCRLTLPVEIVAPMNVKGDRVLGALEKSGNREKLLKVGEPTLTAVSALASKVFSVLGVHDFGRIDVKMDAHGVLHFMEINLVPGMTPKTSYFPRACEVDSMMSYESVALKMIEIALTRNDLPALSEMTKSELPVHLEA